MFDHSILIENIRNGINLLADFDKKTLSDQGHKATGKLIESIEGKVNITQDAIEANIEALDYGLDLERRKTPREALRASKQKIRAWIKVIKPSYSDQRVESFMYAIFATWAKEGSPTEASRRFSKTGQRTGWIKEGTSYAEDNDESLFKMGEWLSYILEHSFMVLEAA